MVLSMPSPNIVSWMSLLGACRKHNDLERAERIMNIIANFPRDPASASHLVGAYVLLSTLYAENSRYADRDRVRLEMEQLGIVKVPGKSSIHLPNGTFTFLSNDEALTRNRKLRVFHAELMQDLLLHGYQPHLALVTKAGVVSDEAKAHLLCAHSEKLAIAFGLMSTDAGPLRITKNLRVCPDCHTASKLISLIHKREIILGDASRHHHFKEGKCSCNDYW